MATDFVSENPSDNDEQKLIFARAAALADSGLFSDYLVYEKNGECWFGGGVARSITLFANRLESNGAQGLSVIQAESRDLCQVLAAELDNWDGQWQACGWAAFELAYALKTPELLNEEEVDGREPLLYLCEPEVHVTLTGGDIRIVGASCGLEQKVRAIVENAQFQEPATAKGVDIPGDENYMDAVRQSVSAIRDDALEKVILSRKVPLHFTPDYTATWLKGRLNNTPARSYTLSLPGWNATGFSPEIVLAVDEQGEVATQPLAGTRRMEGDAERDKDIFNELFKDPKETHEHAISVRLSVDEMEAVCATDSVSVRQFMSRKQRGSVQHLASRVCGQLKENCNAWHAFESLFPAVTASGIQKQAAFSEIRRRERSSRGLYAGAVLRLDHTGAMDAALVLRSILGKGDQSWLQAGAGVVLDSTPQRELTETSEKLTSISPWVVEKTN